MGPGVDEAAIPNNTTAEAHNNGFNITASSIANAGSQHIATESFLARIIFHLAFDKPGRLHRLD
jgi:hypothetical protein